MVFTGHEHDSETGLIYMKARFYDPDSARFISQDKYLGENSTPPSLHRFLYAYSNPLAYIDPDGYASYYFGGTGNHPEEGVGYDGKYEENYRTVIEKLYEADKGDKAYAYGIGTGYEPDGTPYKPSITTESRILNEIATGESMDTRVEYMIAELEQRLTRGDNEVNTYGFSRGGASVVDFLNRIQDKIDEGDPLYKNIEINFVAIVDAVPSKRPAILNSYSNANHGGRKVDRRGRVTSQKPDFRFELPKNMKFKNQPIHTVAIDERRLNFAVSDLKRAKQVGFRGVHSDVGGWYQNNPFDWHVRDYILSEAKKAGAHSFDQSKLDSYARVGEKQYEFWKSFKKHNWARNYQKPYDNSGSLFIDDDEDRVLPKNLLLHESVEHFGTPPLNDISNKKKLK